MNQRNFSGGPGVLPDCVLQEAQQAIGCVDGVGLSVLGISHRSDWFAAVVAEAERNIRELLGLPERYAVLFLQGGATLQFSMVPMLLLRGTGKTAEYLRTGYWSSKSIPPAYHEGAVRILWDGEPLHYRRLPRADQLRPDPDAAYLHYVSNETVEGIQFHWIPGLDTVPRVCDMSSDFLSRPCDATRYAILYAHAQKNLGPAGVTIVVIDRERLAQAPDDLPEIFDYRVHLRAGSIYNTPPVFAIYVVLLVTRWLRDSIGGLTRMAAINAEKARRLYAVLDASDGFYQGLAEREDRSLMNLVWQLPNAVLEADFLRHAEQAGFSGLRGHRALGGIRASLYNAMTLEAVEALADLMQTFGRQARC